MVLFQVLLENLDIQHSRFIQEESFLLQHNIRRYKQNFQVCLDGICGKQKWICSAPFALISMIVEYLFACCLSQGKDFYFALPSCKYGQVVIGIQCLVYQHTRCFCSHYPACANDLSPLIEVPG